MPISLAPALFHGQPKSEFCARLTTYPDNASNSRELSCIAKSFATCDDSLTNSLEAEPRSASSLPY